MFRNTVELRDDLKPNAVTLRDPFGRLGPDDDETDTEIASIKNATTLQAPVGDTGQNRRRDVAKTEQLLGEAGTLDLKKTDGPTGFWRTRTSDATKTFQKQNDLKVDGQINPGGETIRALGKRASQMVKADQTPRHPRVGGDPLSAQQRISTGQQERSDSHLHGNNDQGRITGLPNFSDETFAENARAAPRMDEGGNWFDVDGSPILNPDTDPRVQKIAAPILAAPAIASEMIPAALAALVAAGTITAAQSKDLQKKFGDMGTASSPEIDPDQRKADRHGQPRISTPPDLPNTETFPADDANTGGTTFETPPASKLPALPPSSANPDDGMTTTFPDQSDDPDINGSQMLEMRRYDRHYDLSKNERPNEKFIEPIDQLGEKLRQTLHKHILSDGVLTDHNGSHTYNITKRKSVKELKSDFDELVEEYGSAAGGGKLDIKPSKLTILFYANDGTIILQRNNTRSGPTLEVKIPHENGYQGRVTYKIRYGQ